MKGLRLVTYVHFGPLTKTLDLVAGGGSGNLVLSWYLEWLLERMPPRLRATPRCGRGGKGDEEGVHKRRKMGEGYDSSIPMHFRRLVDEWEADVVAQ